ncbi:hypothetical protein [Deinococcus sp.]|uniref:hypothetical protein n=1 Tax=Deinococcus sp. TaxID=47478 RepID=UPI002869BFB1|nr:hypothetical protein [Deinococcus sp.]
MPGEFSAKTIQAIWAHWERVLGVPNLTSSAGTTVVTHHSGGTLAGYAGLYVWSAAHRRATVSWLR